MKKSCNSSVLIAAFRYALGRKTYIVSDIVQAIVDCWEDSPRPDQILYHREIREAINTGKAGMTMDVNQWQKILELSIKQL